MAEIVGGVEDHVQLLGSLKTTHAPADITREIKKASSNWMAQHHDPRFAWQEGYAIFSVSWTHSQALRSYIANQADHHRKTSFVDELKKLLEKNGVAYDPKHLH